MAKTLTAAAALLTFLSADCRAQIQNVVSYTMYADGQCTGAEMIPAFIGKQVKWFSAPGGNIMGPDKVSGMGFPAGNLWVIGVALNVEYPGLDPTLYPYTMAMSGIENGLGGDYLVPKFAEPGTRQMMFPLGFAMALVNGDIASRHVDMHISCPASQGATWNGTLTLYTVEN